MFRKEMLVICFLMLSCKSYDDLAGKKYSAFNDEKAVVIEFVNDTVCKVQQSFFCNELPKNYKQINFKATYKVDRINLKLYNQDLKISKLKTSILIVNNIDYPADSQRYQVIPNYEELSCSFWNLEDERLHEKLKSGVIYNLINDTLLIWKNEIFFDNLRLEQQ